MRLMYLLLLVVGYSVSAQSLAPKSPCLTDPVYRQFDFWIGYWEVYGKNGKKAGDSRIEIILDSCIILENWTSANGGYAGKSFNTYNAVSRQWQQTWVDNRGGSTEFMEGRFDNGRMIRTKIWKVFAPSISALSSSSFGIDRKNWRRKNTPNAPAAPGTMSAMRVSSQPSRSIMR